MIKDPPAPHHPPQLSRGRRRRSVAAFADVPTGYVVDAHGRPRRARLSHQAAGAGEIRAGRRRRHLPLRPGGQPGGCSARSRWRRRATSWWPPPTASPRPRWSAICCMGMARNRGLAGLVTDGLVRDLPGILAVGLPVYCAGVTPNSPARNGPGTVGLPVVVGGVGRGVRRHRHRRCGRHRDRPALGGGCCHRQAGGYPRRRSGARRQGEGWPAGAGVLQERAGVGPGGGGGVTPQLILSSRIRRVSDGCPGPKNTGGD